MPYEQWFKKVEKKVTPVTEWTLFWRVSLFSFAIFLVIYNYIAFLTPPFNVNKSVADTSVVLIGLSMVLSSICYFWDFADTKIIYRKHLGLVGFAYALAHGVLSQRAFWALFDQQFLSQRTWPALAGTVATLIFAVMTIISNKYSALKLGGVLWRKILRTGYLGLVLVWVHVILLKWKRWLGWWQEGPESWPAMSLIVSVFIGWVLVMRLFLWWSLRKRASTARTSV